MSRSAIGAGLDQLSDDTFVELNPVGLTKAGALARMQGLAHDRRRALLPDVVLFVTAQESGLTLVSGNVSDVDLLLRVGGEANVLLYCV
jgi:hypothetical protein